MKSFDETGVAVVVVGGVICVAILAASAFVGKANADCVTQCTAAGHAPAECKDACR